MRNIILTETQAALVDALVRSGSYKDGDAVLEEGLRLVERRDGADSLKQVALRAAADIGLAALDRGDFIEFDDVDALAVHLSAIAKEIAEVPIR